MKWKKFLIGESEITITKFSDDLYTLAAKSGSTVSITKFTCLELKKLIKVSKELLNSNFN